MYVDCVIGISAIGLVARSSATLSVCMPAGHSPCRLLFVAKNTARESHLVPSL